MKEHVQFHSFYSSFFLRLLRFVALLSLAGLVCLSLLDGVLPKLPLFFLSWFVMWEVFYHFSCSRLMPQVTIEQNDGKQPLASATHETIDAVFAGKTTASILRALFHYPQITFILERLQLTEKEIQIREIPSETWITQAFDLAKSLKGRYVTSMDVFVAYLLLTEAETKLLFTKELKPDDLKEVLTWARLMYAQEEDKQAIHTAMAGDGIGESLITGWTPETQKYTTDFTRTALSKIDGITGRDAEYQQLVNALTKPEMRNALLVGEAGVGKEKLVATLAQESYAGNLSGVLNHKRIITLMVGPLMAGAENRSELEGRLQVIIAELSHAGNIVLFIPELQEVMGESSFNLNLSGALLPYLKDGHLPIIATMTHGNYKTYMEKNGLREVFTVVDLPEPDTETATRMVFQKLKETEKLYHVIVPYNSVTTAIALSRNYLPDDVLPGSAIRLLHDAIQNTDGKVMLHGKRVITPEGITSMVEGKVHASIALPKQEEKALLLNLEKELHARVIGQEHAISIISEAMRRRRSGLTKHDRPVSFLFLGPTGVGKTETAKALSDLYFGGEEKMIRLDMSEYGTENSVYRLLGAPKGAGDERGELTDKMHDNPYTLLLLDEFEKAHPKILDLFLQVLSDGRLTDNKGRTVSFTDTIIIATSNAGSEFIREEIQKGIPVDKAFQTQLLETLQTEHVFKPELLNRFDGVVTFTPLSGTELEQVTRLLLKSVTAQLAERDITVTFADQVITTIIREGYDEQFGARPLRRYIQDSIEDIMARLTLEDKVKRGDTVNFTVDTTGAIHTDVSERG